MPSFEYPWIDVTKLPLFCLDIIDKNPFNTSAGYSRRSLQSIKKCSIFRSLLLEIIFFSLPGVFLMMVWYGLLYWFTGKFYATLWSGCMLLSSPRWITAFLVNGCRLKYEKESTVTLLLQCGSSEPTSVLKYSCHAELLV